MSNADMTAIVFSAPMAILTIALVGVLRSKWVFGAIGFIVIILTLGVLVYGSAMSAMGSNGIGGSGGWDGSSHLLLSFRIGFSLLIIGILIRPKITKYDEGHDVPEQK